ncbi:MAG: radical SAM protein, partial [Saprospiraceae bacterium]|nr:radical SAM protein [Saprospiraceae bacterium]
MKKIDHLIKSENLDAGLRRIAEKVAGGESVTPEEGILLYEKGPLPFLGVLANFIREKKHGHRTYFNRNFHVEPTNVCLYTCTFCSYSRLIKKREEGWEYSMDDIMDIVRKYDDQAVTEVHIVGGVLPQYDLDFYTGLFSKIKAHRNDLHIKALTPVEYHYIFKKAKVSYEEGMRKMKEAG